MDKEANQSEKEWDEILFDKLMGQKAKLFDFAAGLKSTELQQWVKEWSVDLPVFSDFNELNKRIVKEFNGENPPEAVGEFIIRGLLLLTSAFDNLLNGDFERALKFAFSIEYQLGIWTGEERASVKRGLEQRSDADLADKKLVLNYYYQNELSELSNDAAAREIFSLKPQLTRMKPRALSLLIGGYKKFLSKCDGSHNGTLVAEKYKQSVLIVDESSFSTESELRSARDFILGKKKNDLKRIEIYVDFGEHGYKLVDYFDKKFLDSSDGS